MSLRIWLFVLLALVSPLSQAQHQAVRGQQLHPCSCWSPSTPCKCNFLAVWFHPKTGKIWGGSGDKDKTEAGARAHAEKRVATWGQWDSFYRKYEIVCGKCVDKESLSTHVKRIASVEFDRWADRAIKAILAQADINETLKKLIGAKASLERPFKDYANNLGERAKDLMALQKELDRELLVHTSKLEELLDQAMQAHVQLQAKPLLARGFVYDKASAVFGYGSVDENGAKDGPWNGWYLGDGEFSTPESGAFAFAGSFQKGRREGTWKLASRFPAMTLEGQFAGDKAHGAWTIRDASGQSMSGSFEGGVWKGEASIGKAFSSAMAPFAALFGGPPEETAPKVAEIPLEILLSKFDALGWELRGSRVFAESDYWYVARMVARSSGDRNYILVQDSVQFARKAFLQGRLQDPEVQSKLSSMWDEYASVNESGIAQNPQIKWNKNYTERQKIWKIRKEAFDLFIPLLSYPYEQWGGKVIERAEFLINELTELTCRAWTDRDEIRSRKNDLVLALRDPSGRTVVNREIAWPRGPMVGKDGNFCVWLQLPFGFNRGPDLPKLEEDFYAVSIDGRFLGNFGIVADKNFLFLQPRKGEKPWARGDVHNLLDGLHGLTMAPMGDERNVAERKEDPKPACPICLGDGLCNRCEGSGVGTPLKCTTCNYARKISEVCGTCKGIPGNADCTRCRGTGRDDCGKCFRKDRMIECDSCKGKGYKKYGKKKKDCGICDGRGKVPCSICTSSCRECFGKLKVLCNKCQLGRIERDCDKCNLDRRIPVACAHCNGKKTCQSCGGKGR